jgi:hypothetical protein
MLVSTWNRARYCRDGGKKHAGVGFKPTPDLLMTALLARRLDFYYDMHNAFLISPVVHVKD